MKVKINDQMICIPPYISTTWDQVTFLQSEKDPESPRFILILHLSDGKVINIPDLDPSLVEIAFSAHTKYLEAKKQTPQNMFQNLLGISPEQGTAIRISGLPGGIEGLENAFQHNQAQSDAPSLPDEIIQKIAGIAKVMTNGDVSEIPKAEPHCNCMHCQVARAIHGGNEAPAEEPVSEEDLTFRNWTIEQSGENLYCVTNPIDQQEQYSVYLGTPVGCTCGEKHCEHMRAVLET